MGLFFDLPTIAINSNDARALSDEEIAKYQMANYDKMRQSVIQPYEYEAMRNHVLWPAPPEKPLDERFADFKARLADAITRHKR